MKRVILVVVLIVVAIFVYVYENNRKGIRSSQPSAEQTKVETEINKSPQPLPQTGVLYKSFYKGVAPFGVRTQTPGPNCYVELISILDKSTVLTAFVRAGEELYIKIPIGTYKVRYALGSTWYGKESLFGQYTVPLSLKKPLEFKETSEGNFGHTIDWYLQSPRDVDIDIEESSEAAF